ncbi:MAG: hypothetical protein ABJZ91_14170, partial [Cyclobacteriaceae bacterium]
MLGSEPSKTNGVDVSGNLIDDDTWTKANSPYNIVGDVGVPAGLTLTIEPGVEINYTGDFRILVFGAIQVNGTETDSVRFNGNSVEGTKYMLEIRRTDLDESNINYASFGGPQGAILQGRSTDSPLNTGLLSICGTSFNNTVILSNPDLVDTENPLNVSALTFCESSISNVKIIGAIIQSDLYQKEGYSFQFSNGSIHKASLQGINLYMDSSTMTNSEIIGFDIPYVKINKSNIQNSFFATVGPGNDIIPAILNLKIRATKIIGTPISAQNIEFSKLQIIAGDNGADLNGAALITLRENVDGFTSSIDSVSFFGDENFNGINLAASNQTLNISNSHFSKLGVGILNSGENDLIVSGSNFFESYLYHISNESIKNISGQNNYWDSDSPTIIASKIYDQNDNLELGLVDFSNFLTEPSIDAPISPPRDVSKAEDGDGELNITWSANPESDLSSYQVHYGNFDGFSFENTVDVGNV